MKSIALAVTSFLLFLTASSTAAEDSKPAVSAAMTVYTYIVGTEATINLCRRIHALDESVYNKVYRKYQNEIRQTVIRIGFLVAQESRRMGVDKQVLMEDLDLFIDRAIQKIEQTVQEDRERFVSTCKDLPKAIMTQEKPFESLTAKFPHEMEIIWEWP
jgi:hypothetical protein